MIPEENRFQSDPDALLAGAPGLPVGWTTEPPDGTDPATVAGLVALLRAHEEAGRGWAGATEEAVLVEVSEHGLTMRENVVVRDPDGVVRAWGSVHDRSAGRMLLVHVVDRGLDPATARACSDLVFDWGERQARALGVERGLTEQQIDTGSFVGDEWQHAWLADRGFERVRTWWQMSRPVVPTEGDLVPDIDRWERDGVVFRGVRREGTGMPEESDLRAVHEVLEGAFTDHFNSSEETFEEFLHRLREDPGHRWDHWWLAELADEGAAPQPCGALVGQVSGSADGPDGSYVAYIGVLASARGRGVAKGLLHTVIADAALRGRDRVGLEVDADSPTGAEGLYTSMGWEPRYVTESWHRTIRIE